MIQQRKLKTLAAVSVLGMAGLQAAPALAVNLRLIDRRITSGNRLVRDTDGFGLADIDFGATENSVPLAVNFNNGPLENGGFRLSIVPPGNTDGKNEISFGSITSTTQGVQIVNPSSTDFRVVINGSNVPNSVGSSGQLVRFNLLAGPDLGAKPDNDNSGLIARDLRFRVTAENYQITTSNGPRSDVSFDAQKVPEPITILGTITALGFGTYCKRKFSKISTEDRLS